MSEDNVAAFLARQTMVDGIVFNCFWEVSEHVLSRIETPAALAGRSALVDYWSENPWVATKKGVNLYVNNKN